MPIEHGAPSEPCSSLVSAKENHEAPHEILKIYKSKLFNLTENYITCLRPVLVTDSLLYGGYQSGTEFSRLHSGAPVEKNSPRNG